MVSCMVTLTDLYARRVGSSVSAELLVKFRDPEPLSSNLTTGYKRNYGDPHEKFNPSRTAF